MRLIVVGVDRSEGARRALAWAVEEAKRHGAVVEAVHALELPVAASTPLGYAPIDLHEDDLGAELDEVRAMVNDVDPDIEVTLGVGGPAGALIDTAGRADLLVVGTRGRGGFAGLLLGSVSQQVTHHAPCPVVIVPEPE
jgi:nucleotide-binding universal stress UspA family protein